MNGDNQSTGLGQIGRQDYQQKQAQLGDKVAQVLPKLSQYTVLKPTLGAKLGKVAEMYELELLCFDDALKAAEKAFTQHIKHDIAE